MVSNYLLEFAAESYGFDKETCQFMTYGREESKQIYTFSMLNKQYVLRFVMCSIDFIYQTRMEMEWLLYLAGNGANVPFPLKTMKGELAVSTTENGKAYVISAFTTVEGCHWDKNDPSLWNINVFHNWGKAVGEMHRLSKDYKPSNEIRSGFDIRGMINEKISMYPSVNIVAEDLLNEIDALPNGNDSYGLIHNDLHPDNFLIDGAHINLVDFDGCAYSWYAFDIGNALYLALWLGRNSTAGVDFSNDIVKYFLQGYLSVNLLSDFWLSKIPLFMLLCKIALFSFGADCENPDNILNDEQQKERMCNIENKILFTGCKIDYSLFRLT